MGGDYQMDLCFNVSNQTVKRVDKNKLVNWSDEYLRLVFDFKSSDWSDCSKFILVFDNGEVYRFGLTGNAFIVPEELLTDVKLVFSIYGVNNSYRITTPKVMLRLLEAGYTSDVAELDVEEFTHDVVEEVYIAINGKADLEHTHTESDITDLGDYSVVGHTHTKSDVTDFNHTHTKSEITDFTHNHDERYYTKTEVDNIIYGLNNKIQLDTDKIIQSEDTIDLTAYVVENGMPKANKTINFYKEE